MILRATLGGALILLSACGAEIESAAALDDDIDLLALGGRIDGSSDPVEDPEADQGAKPEAQQPGAAEPESSGASEAAASPVLAPGLDPDGPTGGEDDPIPLNFSHLSLDELDDIELEDLLDALLYPDEYTVEDRTFPEQIQALDGKEVALRGFMIPVVWEETEVVEFMHVGDLLACCFGGAPQPDEWVSVTMPEGEGAEYFSFLPVVVRGTFHISALEDEAGYAAGCFRIDGKEVLREP